MENHFTNLKHDSKVSQGQASVLKQALSGDNMNLHILQQYPCEMSIEI
jgi:hypothetical protein